MRYFRWAVGFLFLFSGFLYGQTVRVESRVDTQSVRIGEPIQYTLSATAPPAYEILIAPWQDTLGGLDIIAVGDPDSSMQSGDMVIRQTLTLMGFDSGYYRIPAVKVGYRLDEGAVQYTQTRNIPVSIETVAVDTTADIRAIKDIMEQPLTFADIAPWLFGGLVFAAIIGVGIWFYIRSKDDKPLFNRKPVIVIPPHEAAMRRLAQIEAERYWQKGEIKQYYVELTDTVRAYLEARFRIPAMESVTDEIIRDLDGKQLSERQLKTLKELLQQADLAKFAKFAPEAGDNLQAMETARDFVKNTKPQPVENTEDQVQPEPQAS